MDQNAAASAAVAQSELCHRCKAIDLDEVFSLDPSDLQTENEDPGLHGRKLADLDANPNAWVISSACVLCRFYGAVARYPGLGSTNIGYGSESDEQNGSDVGDAGRLSLWVRPGPSVGVSSGLSGRTMVAGSDTLPKIILQVLPEPSRMPAIISDIYLFDQDSLRETTINEQEPQSEGGHPLPAPPGPGDDGLIGMDALRSFIHYCRSHHADSTICGTRQGSRGPPIPSFRAIDVYELRVVALAQDTTYTALSYRWGPLAYDSLSQPFGPDGELRDITALPELISDAIKVTKYLGFRYCWVDRYCIPQDDPHVMEIQLGRMDEIYRLAEVTIIAATHAPYLPGVTRKLDTSIPATMRLRQRTIAAGSLEFMDIHIRVLSSPWSSRAWTYQEGLLSRRRLFFTDTGVSYECGRMESGELGFGAPQIRWISRDDRKAPWLLPKDSSLREESLLHCLTEYSGREMTFERDRLNAALGIFHIFESAQPLRHYLGTPIRLSIRRGQDAGATSAQDVVSGFLCGMLFGNGTRETSKRCKALPSWSWTGWTGRVVFHFTLQYRPTSEPRAFHMAVHMISELADGTLLPWDSVESIQQLRSAPPSALSNFIHIDALTVQIQLDTHSFEESGKEEDIFEPLMFNLGFEEFAGATGQEFHLPQTRWHVLEIPGRGRIYIETNLQRCPAPIYDDYEEQAKLDAFGLKTGIVVAISHYADALAIILMRPLDGEPGDTMERIGFITLEPFCTVFRPYRSARRRRPVAEEGREDYLGDYIQRLNQLTDEEKRQEMGLPTWNEVMSLFWKSVQAERRTIRLG